MPGKVLTRILLYRVRQKLLTHQRLSSLVSLPKKSTVDRILALDVLTERLRDFRNGVLVAFLTLLQGKGPLIHILHSKMTELVKQVLLRSVKPEVIEGKQCQELRTCDLSDVRCQVTDENW